MLIVRKVMMASGQFLECAVQDDPGNDETQIGFENRMIEMLNRVSYEQYKDHEYSDQEK